MSRLKGTRFQIIRHMQGKVRRHYWKWKWQLETTKERLSFSVTSPTFICTEQLCSDCEWNDLETKYLICVCSSSLKSCKQAAQGKKSVNLLKLIFCVKMNSLFLQLYINHPIENLINWAITETWKRNCTPVQTAVWFNGRTIHPVFELAAYSFHTKPCYYPADWLVSLLFSLVLVHWYPS